MDADLPAARLHERLGMGRRVRPERKTFHRSPRQLLRAIVGATDLHVIQKLDAARGRDKEAGSYVAPFKSRLRSIPVTGAVMSIALHDGIEFASVIEHTHDSAARHGRR